MPVNDHRRDNLDAPPPSRFLGVWLIAAGALVYFFGPTVLGFSSAFYVLVIEPMTYEETNQYPTYTYRFRLTINVDVDGETHTGSGVYEVSAKPGPKGTMWGAPQSKGEAIYIDLGKYNPLVMTLRRPHYGAGYDCPANMLSGGFWAPPGSKLSGAESDKILASSNHPPISLGVRGLCEMVTFGNLADPKTIRVVDPRNLESSFDGHVHFVSATVEVTSDPITRGIEARLPWLPVVRRHIGGQLDEETALAQLEQLRAKQRITIGIDRPEFQYKDFTGEI